MKANENPIVKEIIAFRRDRKGTYVSTTHDMNLKEYLSISEWLVKTYTNYTVLKYDKTYTKKAGLISITIIN